MDNTTLSWHWNYLYLLCEKFNNTKDIIYHGVNDQGIIIHGEVYSLEFMNILLSVCAEFESISKQFCKEINPSFNDKSNILDISQTLLKKYPKIGQTEIYNEYQKFKPLKDWKIVPLADGNMRVDGIEWWHAYTDIKHHGYVKFEKANLMNCTYSLGALTVVELYCNYHVNGNLNNCIKLPCFSYDYGNHPVSLGFGVLLPDF